MPNEQGRYNKEEAYGTGLPIYMPGSKRWTSKPYEFAVLLSKTRCQEFGTPILRNDQEKPSAFLYAPNAGMGTVDLKHRYIPLYDRTSLITAGAISQARLYDREIMRGDHDQVHS